MENYVLAQLWRRALAAWIDLLIISIPPCLWIIGVLSDLGNRYHVESWYQQYLWQEWLPWAWVFAVFFYYAASESRWGATAGKRLLRIEVVRIDGSPCNWHAALVRNIWRFVDGWLFWWLGLIVILCSKKRQRIGDMLAKTVVVMRPNRAALPPG